LFGKIGCLGIVSNILFQEILLMRISVFPLKRGKIPAIGDGEAAVKKVLFDMEITNHPIPVL